MVDPDSLKAAIKSFKDLRAVLDGRLSAWNWLVITGAAFELVTLLHEYRDNLRTWKKARSMRYHPWPEKPPFKWLLFDLAGVLFVVGGIVGEIRVDSQIGKNETNLQDANEQLVSFLEQEAGDAADNAQAAQDSADDANEDLDTATKKLAAVTKEANGVDSNLSMTQYLMSGREVHDAKGLTEQLAPFKGQAITFRSYLHDGEGYFLCEEIVASAHSAGVLDRDECGTWKFTGAHPDTGIGV
jgi:outer membrane murein-binding lipoprotein Lpp